MKTKKYVNGGPIVPDPRDKKPIVNEANRKPIYTSNLNDPRLKAYQDSLYVRTLNPQTFSPGNKTRSLTPNEKTFWKDEKTGLVPNLVEYNPDNPTSGYFGHYKKPVQPVYLGAEKTIVKPKDFSVKKKELAPQKSLPKSVTGVKMDASGTNVYLSVNEKQTVMPKKEFAAWLKNSDNRAMYDKYRTSVAKK